MVSVAWNPILATVERAIATGAQDPADKPGNREGKSQNQGALPFPVWLEFVCLPHRLLPADMGVCQVSSFDWHLQHKGSKEPPAFQELFSSGLAE